MPAVIRLKRVGAKKDAAFRIVVADSRRARDGRFIDHLGFYDPQPRVAQFKVDVERANYWLSVGARASDQVRSLLKKAGVIMPHTPRKAKKAEAKAAKPKKTKGAAKKSVSAREKSRRDRKREQRAGKRAVVAKKKAKPAAAAKPAEAAAAAS
jgi:small subunit ribosomal protein S16